MRKILSICAVLAAAFTCQAQFSNSIPFKIDMSATNWLAVPYFSYDIEKKQGGAGAALLYKVSDNFWAGARVQYMKNHQTTAAVQAQLNIPVTVGPFTVIPFLEGSTGLGKDLIYASTGPGAVIRLYSHNFKKFVLYADLIGDYEHYVDGASNGNVANGGLGLGISF